MAIKATEVKPLSGALAQRGVRGLSRTGARGRIPANAVAGVNLQRVGAALAGANGYRVREVQAGPGFAGVALGDLVMVVE